jgi:hypothetical protein
MFGGPAKHFLPPGFAQDGRSLGGWFIQSFAQEVDQFSTFLAAQGLSGG